MRKASKTVAIFLLAAMLLSVTAFAAPGESHANGVYDLKAESGYTIKPLNVGGTAATAFTGTVSGSTKTVYDGVEKFTLTFAGTADVQYAVFLLSDSGEVPTQNNIRYIDQQSGSTTVTFSVYPDKLTTAGEHNIYVSSSEGYKKAGSFKVAAIWTEAAFVLGDVNNSGTIDVNDALLIMSYVVGNKELDETQKLAANCNGVTGIDINDALRIMSYVVGNAQLG